jgi:hypothetical protein
LAVPGAINDQPQTIPIIQTKKAAGATNIITAHINSIITPPTKPMRSFGIAGKAAAWNDGTFNDERAGTAKVNDSFFSRLAQRFAVFGKAAASAAERSFSTSIRDDPEPSPLVITTKKFPPP